VPTYDLTCEDCGFRFEQFLTRLIRQEDKVCPSCGSDRVKNGIGGGILGIGTTPSKSGSCSSSSFS